MVEEKGKWQFWIDRGGTFTDVVVLHPDGHFTSHKYLSENPDQYKDAAVFAMRQIMNIPDGEPFPSDEVTAIKMGTTVATNALLERKGEKTVLVTNKGLADALMIGQQHRENLFALQPGRPAPLYDDVIEVSGRIDAQGEEIEALDLKEVQRLLKTAHSAGYKAAAILLMHASANESHENTVARIAGQCGFIQISVSHEASSTYKYIHRGDTAVVDAYLSPVLDHYVNQIRSEVGKTPLYFMRSHGGLTSAEYFRGKDAILSGPAGGIVGAALTAQLARSKEIIAFDMGGTSTDVSHYAGNYERTNNSVVAGVKVAIPMMDIHTVAAGGGSICRYTQGRLQVGPDSAGAHPGPACYGKQGPVTVTDCNLILGKIQSDQFPAVFGPRGNLPLNKEAALNRLDPIIERMNKDTGKRYTPEEVAEGFISVANEHMARAIRKVSVERGHDVKRHSLLTFGGAGGQHCCGVADALGISKVIVPPYSGVLSALGMGLADMRSIKGRPVEKRITTQMKLNALIKELTRQAGVELLNQGILFKDIKFIRRLHVKYEGSDTALPIEVQQLKEVRSAFETAHKKAFGFSEPKRHMVLETLEIEAFGGGDPTALSARPKYVEGDYFNRAVFYEDKERDTHFIRKENIPLNRPTNGPMVILEGNATTVVPPDWFVRRDDFDNLIIQRRNQYTQATLSTDEVDPIMLEVFNNLFMSTAEEMGAVLANTAKSVNIKERLDFSCAVFDRDGNLIANAPHMPVHLGSMGDSVKTVIRDNKYIFEDDVFMLNDPYDGGTHLPDITVITPVFVAAAIEPDFYVASRGHHADIGGITPGSMPAFSTKIEEEGIRFTNFHLVKRGSFQEQVLRKHLTTGEYPARNVEQNIADLKAQIAANKRGVEKVKQLVYDFNPPTVNAYMGFVRDNAEKAVRHAITRLKNGRYSYKMDCGAEIRIKVTIDNREGEATLDFSGTSPQQDNNFNAPLSVTKAAVLYVFRVLAKTDIPLNAGCLAPLKINVPEGCFLNPKYPAAVVAGNVETSQAVTNALFMATRTMAASQGTMNNLTFGDDKRQYYETIAGGTGAGPDFDGCDAIQSHMTNSRLTDPEVLERRYPVLLREFSVRENSGGNGASHGGNGLVREIEFLDQMHISILSGHRDNAPPGLEKGEDGKTGKSLVLHCDGHETQLQGCDSYDIAPNDRLRIETPGGGGFGRPT